MGVADVVEFVARRPDVHQRTYKPDDIWGGYVSVFFFIT